LEVSLLGMINNKWVVIFIGPPGSGKGTQADILAEKFGIVHLESSKVIENKFKNADPNDEVITAEKKIWESGELNTPELVRAWMIEAIRELHSKGMGIVLSGSPRTLFEAEGEIPIFEELYGRDNIKTIHLNLTKEESIRRNSSRRICQANRHPIPDLPMFKDVTTCPKDESPLIRRTLDAPETIAIRYEVYLRRTQPIISFIQERDYNIIEIEGEQSIEKVANDILGQISNDKD
jgi:adenylate kinase